ncbi:MAG TPA: putative transporter [Abditibacteriaceae bacterium]
MWITELLHGESVAHSVLVLGVVAVFGLLLGRLQYKGVGPGVAGVLFAGLFFGHLGFTLNTPVLDFVREFGLILFVYSIGLQVGPGFLTSMRQQGLKLNALAAYIVFSGVLCTLVVSKFGNIPMAIAVGLFSGGTTNTPSLAAAQQALKDLPNISSQVETMPSLGYAISYPLGVTGIITTMLLTRALFRIDARAEARRLEGEKIERNGILRTMNIAVTNVAMEGKALNEIPVTVDGTAIVSRVLHHECISIARPETRLSIGDVVLAVGTQEHLDALMATLGKESAVDLRTYPAGISAQWILVTNRRAVGKTLASLHLTEHHGVSVTRLSRAEIELTPHANSTLHFGDALLAVGPAEGLKAVADELGNSVQQLNQPQMIPIFIGMTIGVLLGSIPFYIPGIPAPIKLGLAGGPLLAALALSNIGRIGPFVWHLPASANSALREFGIILFLACVGLRAGDQFIPTLQNGGMHWMAWATLITFAPLVSAALFARIVWKLNYASLVGLIAGSTTSPPALAFATSTTESDVPTYSYATVYPLVMILRIVMAQILVLFFVR